VIFYNLGFNGLRGKAWTLCVENVSISGNDFLLWVKPKAYFKFSSCFKIESGCLFRMALLTWRVKRSRVGNKIFKLLSEGRSKDELLLWSGCCSACKLSSRLGKIVIVFYKDEFIN
jgi:hypothetical protein